MRCIAIIPARYQSSRFPGKPLASLQGRPLIAHVAARCLEAGCFDAVIVATDDERIADAAVAAGVESRLTPATLTSGTDRVAHVAESESADLIVNVQGDEPLFDAAGLAKAVEAFGESTDDYATLRSPLEASDDLWNPNVVKVVVDADGRALYFSRAPIPFPRGAGRVLPDGGHGLEFDPEAVPLGPFWAHVGIYLYRRQALLTWARMPESPLERVEALEQLRILEAGGVLRTYPVAAAAPGVDTPEDLERVRAILAGG